ncbi:MAG: efflux transporter outer membrane subunit [bacterium]
MKFSVIVLYCVIITCVCACASSSRQLTQPPPMITPEAWSASYPHVSGTIENWWEGFGDDRLNELVLHSLKRNYNVKAALARIDAANSQARIIGADLAPVMDGSFSASRQKQNVSGVSFPSDPSNSFGASLNLSWEIDLWGRLRSARSAAIADIEVSHAELSGVKLSLAAQTVKAWFACIEATGQLDLSHAHVDNFKKSRDQIRMRYERGLASSLDVRLAEANVSAAEACFYIRQDQLHLLIRRLEILVGRYPSGELKVGDRLPTIMNSVPAGIPAEIVSRRPDLVAAEHRLAAAGLRIKQSEASLYPRIALTASGGRSSDELEELLDGDFSVFRLAGNLVQPLFQGGKLRAGVALARARVKEARALFAQSLLNAYAEVESTLNTEIILARREKVQSLAVEQALAARDLAQEQYTAGLVDYLTLLEAQRSAYEAQSQLLSLKRQRIDARIDLYLALGGGFMNATHTKKEEERD